MSRILSIIGALGVLMGLYVAFNNVMCGQNVC